MSDEFYTDMQSVASEIMAEFKQGTVNLVQLTTGAGAADNPGAPTETTTSLNATVRGVSFKYVMEGLAVKSDLEVTAAVVAGKTPNKNDFIEIGGVRHKIIQDVSVPSTGIKAIWKFIVRKG